MSWNLLINFSYIISAALFIYGLKMLSHPQSARRGNFLSSLGMLLALIVTLLNRDIIDFRWIILGIVIGTIIGAFAARLVAMTQMPEMVALFNGSGGIASLLVGWGVYHYAPDSSVFSLVTILLSILIGGVTFTGSIIAWAKLSELISGKPFLFKGQNVLNAILLIGIIVAGVIFILYPEFRPELIIGIIIFSLIMGILTVIPIGGADMPGIISLLNSYSGLAACAAGFVISNNLLIVAGALVGASGIILTNIMCKAMNRSLVNVLFTGFGAQSQTVGKGHEGEVKPINTEDAYLILEAASSVVFVPGYGLAVAQAQHVVKELGDQLEKNGCEVQYAIHPVAGRMPGHMNVLLAEANVPYDKLVEMDDINPKINMVDVAVVIGANDVVNPAAREDKDSPIYGMPIINVDQARTVFVLKRSMAAGFAGIQNNLFYNENTRMLFGDAKDSIQALVAEFKSTH